MALSKDLKQSDREAFGFRESFEKHLELQPQQVVCPAAMGFAGAVRPCVLCRVDQSLVRAEHSPGTYYGRCTSANYDGCPSWRAERDAEMNLRLLQKQQGG
jgi:hypothetical protein